MKVSIITIVYNRAHLIEETIKSVLNQTYTNFEHIIIDDGSTDNTENIVLNFKDPRIKYYKYEKQKRRSFLRNEGIRKSEGNLISILDSDDIWTKDKLATVTSMFNENSEINFVIHNLLFLPKSESFKNPFTNYKTDFYKYILDDLLNDLILPYPIFTIKKDYLVSIGLLDENHLDGQYDLYLRVASNSKVYYCSKVLTFMKKHQGNISSKFDITHCLDAINSYDKLYKTKKINPKQYKVASNVMNYKIAHFYFRNSNKKNVHIYANRVLNNSSIFNKWHMKSRILKLIS